MKLFLDDYRIPYDVFKYIGYQIYLEKDWNIVRNYDEFCKFISEHGLPTTISFDHDLSDIHYNHKNQVGEINYDEFVEKTGFHCAKWMIDYMLDNDIFELPTCYIHSMNPVGSKNIKSLFEVLKIY
jgi:hypothetical protein